MKFTVHDGALVGGAIWPAEKTLARLLPFHEVTGVLGAVGPLFLAFAMLEVFLPVAMVLDSLYARKDSVSILTAIDPVAFIDASVSEDHAPAPICFVGVPEALKGALVVPHDGTAALPLPSGAVYLTVVGLTLAQRDLGIGQVETPLVLILFLLSSVVGMV